ncbi:unnamed protein product, partial [Brassica oleracea]
QQDNTNYRIRGLQFYIAVNHLYLECHEQSQKLLQNFVKSLYHVVNIYNIAETS